MEGVRSPQARGRHRIVNEQGGEAFHLRYWPRDNGEQGTVHCGDLQAVRKPGRDGLLRQRYGKHRAGLRLLHQLSPGDCQAGSVGKREDSRQASR